MKYKIGIIGRIAEDEKLFDGQTVKTRNLKDMLSEISGLESVYIVDTYNYNKNLPMVFVKTLICMAKCDKIILSISINGRKVFFPLLYYLNKIFRKEIYHSLIGGRLVANIEQFPSWKKYVKAFKANWVETHELVESLENIGVDNAIYIPNFKKISPIDKKMMKKYESDIFKFCTFSRVQELKGITDAILTMKKIKEDNPNIKIHLDIFGPIDRDYETQFLKLVNDNNEIVSYEGCIDASLSVEYLENYYMLLFPTKYFNEGIPGTIIDAMASGLPVIASNWHYCNEMIQHLYNGLVYNFDDQAGLKNMVEYAVLHSDLINNMKEHCLEKASEYMYINVIDRIRTSMNMKMETIDESYTSNT